MKADGVHHLSLCPVCGKLGDERLMVKAGPMEWVAHDRCVFEQLGEGILNLPKEERAHYANKFNKQKDESKRHASPVKHKRGSSS